MKSLVEVEYIRFLPLRSILWYQIEKQRLCKSINGRFLIKTVVVKMKSNWNIEELTTDVKIYEFNI
jgi:hypothetical protein